MKIKTLPLLIIALILSCQENIHKPSQHILLRDITIDTSYGYPYPSNYDWEEMVKSGKLNELQRKSPSSPTPLITLLSNNTVELYRISAFPFTFVITVRDTFSEISIMMSNHTYDDMQYSNIMKNKTINDIQIFKKNLYLGKEATINLRKDIHSSNFWSTEMNDGIVIMDFGITYEMEGIKDSIYSLIWQTEPKRYNKPLYSTVKNLITIAKKEGLLAQTDGRMHW